MTRIILCAFLFLLSGCITTRHGDAKVKTTNVPFSGKGMNRWLFLPEFSISEVGVHHFTIKNLPATIYPRDLVIRRDSTPCVGTSFIIQMKDLAGATFFEDAYELDNPHDFSSVIDASFYLLDVRALEPRDSYEVVVQITKPCSQPRAVAWLQGSWSQGN